MEILEVIINKYILNFHKTDIIKLLMFHAGIILIYSKLLIKSLSQ